MNGDSLNKAYLLPGFAGLPNRLAASQPRWQMDYDAILKANGVMLEGVTVSAEKRPAQLVDERYTTGMFSGDAG